MWEWLNPYSLVGRALGGNWGPVPEDPLRVVDPEARELILKCFEELRVRAGPDAAVMDYHTHLGGIGTGGTGCYVNPILRSPLRHPLAHLHYAVFLAGAGVRDVQCCDQEYVERLVRWILAIKKSGLPWGKHCLLPLDYWYDEDGTVRPDLTGMHVPNEYVWSVAQEYPDLFEACISVHPYRRDALEELDRWADKGVKIVKWLPNTMNINPAYEKCQPFYDKMKQRGMTLLCHCGTEHSTAVVACDNSLANPLLLRRALNTGVKVIVAHCAGEGTNLDFDSPIKVSRSNFELFMRLMEQPAYNGLLFGDISSMTVTARSGGPLATMIERRDLHHRLVNGSDHPLPSLNCTISTRLLEFRGYIDRKERELLNEIFKVNPLLFDLVLKCTMRAPGSGLHFSPSVFFPNPTLSTSTPTPSKTMEERESRR